MSNLADELMAQLQGAPAQQMAQQLGANPEQVQQALGAALPMLLGALGRNAQQPGGAEALLGALERDHGAAAAGGGQQALNLGGLLGGLLGGGAQGGGAAGGLGGLLGSVLGGGAPASRQVDAGGILGHILGGAQPRAEAGLGQAAGMSSNQSAQLLKMLAPIVMAFLANRARAGNLDAGGLGGLLGQEHAQVQQQGGLAGGLLGAVLDQNGDGKFDMSDLLKMGGSLLGGRR
ncbi:MAG: DUF937 domain-containing protein [Pseudomonadota bacterium]|nr:DUF937 domain-containing protein [Pseudomonadota bacterium]